MGETAAGTGMALSGPSTTIYYWRRGFVQLAPSYLLERRRRPYRRLSVSLMFGLKQAFTIETDEGGSVTARALLIAPKVARRRISALDSDFVICDMALATPEFHALAPLLDGAPLRVLDERKLAPLVAGFRRAGSGEMPAGELRDLVHRTIIEFTGRRPEAPPLHPRIARALQLIDEQPLRAISPGWLTGQVHLSASRLRALFSTELGSSLTHYLRWNAVWKAAWLWSRGRPLVDVVEAAGFYDLAHLNRAFNEVFGLNPSDLFHPDQVRLIRCDWD